MDRLHRASPEVREWRPRHEFVSLGELTLRYVVLNVADHPDHKLVTYSAEEGEEGRLRELAASIPLGFPR